MQRISENLTAHAPVQVHIINSDGASLLIAALAAAATLLAVLVALAQLVREARLRTRDVRTESLRRHAEAVVEAISSTANAAALFVNVLPLVQKLFDEPSAVTAAMHQRVADALDALEPARQAAHSARLRVLVLRGDDHVYQAVERLVEIVDRQRGAARNILRWTVPGSPVTGDPPDRRPLRAPGLGRARSECIAIAQSLASGNSLRVTTPSNPVTPSGSLADALAQVARVAVRAHRRFYGVPATGTIQASPSINGERLEVRVSGNALFGFMSPEKASDRDLLTRLEKFESGARTRRIKDIERLHPAGVQQYLLRLDHDPPCLVETFVLVPDAKSEPSRVFCRILVGERMLRYAQEDRSGGQAASGEVGR